MNLSPLDIRRQQFAKAFRGYDPAEVDAFLKQISEQQESLLESVRRAEEKARDAEAKLTHYERVELALQEALESARESARRAEASAGEKARLTIEEAELRAEKILQEAERERYAIRQDIIKLNARQSEAAARLRGFLLSELEVLAQFQGDDPVGFIKLQPSGTPGTLPLPPQAQLTSGDEDDLDAPAPQDSAPQGASSQDEEDRDAVKPEANESETEPLAVPLGESDEDADEEAPPSETEEASPSETTEEPRAAGPPQPPAVTGGWDLRSLVTGGERSAAASEAERERIRRILDDLD